MSLTSSRIVRKETLSRAQRVQGVVEMMEAARGALLASVSIPGACEATHLCIKASSPNELPLTLVATFLPKTGSSPLSASMT